MVDCFSPLAGAILMGVQAMGVQAMGGWRWANPAKRKTIFILKGEPDQAPASRR
jgi:hypothetical protein